MKKIFVIEDVVEMVRAFHRVRLTGDDRPIMPQDGKLVLGDTMSAPVFFRLVRAA